MSLVVRVHACAHEGAQLLGWHGRRVCAHVRQACPLADKVVFYKVKDKLGGRTRLMISGGAPLARHVEEFLKARAPACCPSARAPRCRLHHLAWRAAQRRARPCQASDCCSRLLRESASRRARCGVDCLPVPACGRAGWLPHARSPRWQAPTRRAVRARRWPCARPSCRATACPRPAAAPSSRCQRRCAALLHTAPAVASLSSQLWQVHALARLGLLRPRAPPSGCMATRWWRACMRMAGGPPAPPRRGRSQSGRQARALSRGRRQMRRRGAQAYTQTVGSPLPLLEARLESVPEMGYDALAVPPRGELLIRGPVVFQGYYRDEAATREARPPWLPSLGVNAG